MYSSTHSKTAVLLNSYWESLESYTALCKILLQLLPSLICPTESDVFDTIDNNKKLENVANVSKKVQKYLLVYVPLLVIFKQNQLRFSKMTKHFPLKLVR